MFPTSHKKTSEPMNSASTCKENANMQIHDKGFSLKRTLLKQNHHQQLFTF